MEKIVIPGASGFVGKYLSNTLIDQGYRVTGVGTSKNHHFTEKYDTFTWISADTCVPGSWQKAVEDADIVINLTGRNIFNYWTTAYKQAIYDSRILTTKNVVDALGKNDNQKLINASAVGIYGDKGDLKLTESSKPGNDFLADVCRDWEKEAQLAAQKDVAVSIMRFGVVLGNGGALEKMIPAFKMFVGGPLGNGRHWLPWIHIADLTTAVQQIIRGELEPGTFNFTGPTPIRQADFAKILGGVLGRPSFMPAPKFVIQTIMGELGKSLLQSQKAVPDQLLKSGFVFQFSDVEAALTDILVSTKI